MGWQDKFNQMKQDIIGELRTEVSGGVSLPVPDDIKDKVKEDLQDWFEERMKEALDVIKPVAMEIDEKVKKIESQKYEIEKISVDTLDTLKKGVEVTEGKVNESLVHIGNKAQEVQREIEEKKKQVEEEIEKDSEGIWSRLKERATDAVVEGVEAAVKDFVAKNSWKIIGWLIQSLFRKAPRV